MSVYKLTLEGSRQFFEAPDGRIIAATPLAALDELNRIHSASITKPEPSRLEIAAMLMAGMVANPGCPEVFIVKDLTESVMGMADALIAEARKEVAK